MSEENENTEVDERAAESSGPLAGERLAAARREQQITVVEVAKELHLDEPKVRALEKNDFDVLGAPVFAKGHLKKYAQLVGVPIDDVLADYYELNRSSAIPPVVGKVRKPVRTMSPGPWIVAIVVLLVAAAAYWFFVLYQPTAPEPEALEQESAAPVDVPQTIVSAAEEPSVQEPVATRTDPVSEPVILDDTPPPAVADGNVRLTMSFSGDCWTEISDGNGVLIFRDLGRSGRQVTVEGVAPLSVLFGAAENVSLRVNGSEHAITAADRRGETARLTVFAP